MRYREAIELLTRHECLYAVLLLRTMHDQQKAAHKATPRKARFPSKLTPIIVEGVQWDVRNTESTTQQIAVRWNISEAKVSEILDGDYNYLLYT